MMARLILAVVLAGTLCSCSLMPGSKPERRTSVYLLETRLPAQPAAAAPGCHIAVINAPESAPGQSGVLMLYRRTPNKLERFAYSRWAASPAAMLEPLLLDALIASDVFSVVLAAPAAVAADLRIENDGLWLIQVFEGEESYLELRMSSRVFAPAQRKLLGSRVFTYAEPAAAPTPAAGVAAADRAVARLLEDYVAFLAAVGQEFPTACAAE